MKFKSIIPDNMHDTGVSDHINSDNAIITAGSVVIIDVNDLTKRKVTCTTISASPLVKGIAESDIAIGKSGGIVLSGIASAKVKTGIDAVAIGSGLATSTTRGMLTLSTSNIIAIALEPVAANTEKTIKVHIRGM